MRRSAILAAIVPALLIGPGVGAGSIPALPPISLGPRCTDQPIVLNEPTDYVLTDVDIRGTYDAAALTLSGDIRTVNISRSRFGQVLAGGNGQAAAVLAQGASVQSLVATDCEFYDAENQLLSTADGTFGRVVFERCSFRVTESFLRQIIERNPWRLAPPTTEFSNIDRLELIDVEFDNTLVVIHPSVKQVIVRGQIDEIHVVDPGTQVIHLEAGQQASDIPSVTI